MKLTRLGTAALLLSVAGCASAPAGAPSAGRSQPGAGPAVHAVGGDTVYLVQHHIRPERRQHFEDFVRETLFPAFIQSGAARPARREALRRIRLLEPVGPDADGTYTYTFLLDPLIQGEEYNVLALLREVYPEDEALRQYGRYTETWARDFTTRAYVQSRDPARQ
jgi:hypothetical protein